MFFLVRLVSRENFISFQRQGLERFKHGFQRGDGRHMVEDRTHRWVSHREQKPPPIKGKAFWSRHRLGCSLAVSVFSCSGLPTLTLECSSQTPVFLRAGGVHESPLVENFATHTALFDLSSAGRTTAKQPEVF